MARVVSTLVLALSALLALAIGAAAVVLVVGQSLGPVATGGLGVAALAVVEMGVALAQRVRIRSAVGGGQRDRVVALGAIALVTVCVAVVAAPSSHPTAASVVIGTAGVVALVTVVGARLRTVTSAVPVDRADRVDAIADLP